MKDGYGKLDVQGFVVYDNQCDNSYGSRIVIWLKSKNQNDVFIDIIHRCFR